TNLSHQNFGSSTSPQSIIGSSGVNSSANRRRQHQETAAPSLGSLRSLLPMDGSRAAGTGNASFCHCDPSPGLPRSPSHVTG
ncbi:hypothetical protein J6590_104858, partial [Homalodisca vitripennis]